MDIIDINVLVASFLSLEDAKSYSRVNRVCLFAGRCRIFEALPISLDVESPHSLRNAKRFVLGTAHVAQAVRHIAVTADDAPNISIHQFVQICDFATGHTNARKISLHHLRWNPLRQPWLGTERYPAHNHRLMRIACHRVTDLDESFFSALRDVFGSVDELHLCNAAFLNSRRPPHGRPLQCRTLRLFAKPGFFDPRPSDFCLPLALVTCCYVRDPSGTFAAALSRMIGDSCSETLQTLSYELARIQDGTRARTLHVYDRSHSSQITSQVPCERSHAS